MTHDDIRELLDSAAPSSPDLSPGARSSAVAIRGRAVTRRNRLALAATVIAVAAAGVTVQLLAPGGDTGADRAPVATDAPTPAVGDVPACPVDPVPVPSSTLAPGDDVTSVRLCPAFADANGALTELTGLPLAALTSGVDEFLDDLRALPSYQPEPMCATAVIEYLPWSMVLAHADGSTTSVGAKAQVCVSVTIDGVERGAHAVLERFTTALNAPAVRWCERSRDRFFAEAAEPPNTYTGDPGDFRPVSVKLCTWSAGPENAYFVREAGPIADPASLWRDVVARTIPFDDVSPCPLNGWLNVVFLDAKGERVTLQGNGCGTHLLSELGDWSPGRAASDALAAALGGRR